MPGVLESLYDFATWIAKGRIPLPDVIPIPRNQCIPPDQMGIDILKGEDYFTVSINELFLSYARIGWTTFSPMVVITTKFLYGGKWISVPAIVGPGLLAAAGQELPQGILLQHTTVAGPYPYRGGPVIISLVFYRVQHKDYAKELLGIVESVSRAVGPAADMGLLSKVGGALIEGLNGLVGMDGTVPISGHRVELSPLKPSGFQTCFSVLLDGDERLPVERLLVDHGRLITLDRDGSPGQHGRINYVLYSVTASRRRDDISALPIYPLYERALEDAARGGEDAWKSAKATLGELWQQMVLSPDLTRAQAAELFQAWKRDLLEAHSTRQEPEMMSSGGDGPSVNERIRGAAAALDI